MTSSTSHSNKRPAQTFILLLTTAVLAWTSAAFYSIYFNPEVRLFTYGATIKRVWLRTLDARFTNRFILFGGSSGTFSFDGEYALQKRGAPIGNLALGAGIGAKALTRFALSEARPGDTLLMSMEPSLLIGELDSPQLATQFAVAIGHPEMAHPDDELLPASPLPWREYLVGLRPGGYHFFTLLGKFVRRQPLYRYSTSDFLPSGQQETAVRKPLAVYSAGGGSLSVSGKKWIKDLASYCAAKKIGLIYVLPWGFSTPEALENCQRENARFLGQVAELIPVLYDARLGSYTVESHFADSPFHLNREGALIRTEEMIDNLLKTKFWAPEELKIRGRL